jgi:hypothetical protein
MTVTDWPSECAGTIIVSINRNHFCLKQPNRLYICGHKVALLVLSLYRKHIPTLKSAHRSSEPTSEQLTRLYTWY